MVIEMKQSCLLNSRSRSIFIPFLVLFFWIGFASKLPQRDGFFLRPKQIPFSDDNHRQNNQTNRINSRRDYHPRRSVLSKSIESDDLLENDEEDLYRSKRSIGEWFQCGADSSILDDTVGLAVVSNKLYQFLLNFTEIVYEPSDNHYSVARKRIYLDVGIRRFLRDDHQAFLSQCSLTDKFDFIYKVDPKRVLNSLRIGMTMQQNMGESHHYHMFFSDKAFLYCSKWTQTSKITRNRRIFRLINSANRIFMLTMTIVKHNEIPDPQTANSIEILDHVSYSKGATGFLCIGTDSGEFWFQKARQDESCKVTQEMKSTIRSIRFGTVIGEHLYLFAFENSYVIIIDARILTEYDTEFHWEKRPLMDVLTCKSRKIPGITRNVGPGITLDYEDPEDPSEMVNIEEQTKPKTIPDKVRITKTKQKSTDWGMIVGIIIGLLIPLAILVWFLIRRRRRMREGYDEGETSEAGSKSSKSGSSGLSKSSFLKSMTGSSQSSRATKRSTKSSFRKSSSSKGSTASSSATRTTIRSTGTSIAGSNIKTKAGTSSRPSSKSSASSAKTRKPSSSPGSRTSPRNKSKVSSKSSASGAPKPKHSKIKSPSSRSSAKRKN
ncbi:hypothetical protein QR98_0030080 [Sarcoptes scabiei]|uniref:Uncharacterized protein n=1 Tax=Sarcoptes scabiei TaxID=52283 RepID=A0A132A0C4_SARSC|nr:hypothetical protein QR98_0030080 [Sarcoptes scabiei]